MCVIIISGVRIFRELLLDYFDRIRLHAVRTADSLETVGAVGPRDVLLLHAEGPIEAIERMLDRDARLQGEERRLILMVPAHLHAQASERLGDRVRALLPDDTTPAAVFGAACVVAEGFDVGAHAAPGSAAGGAQRPQAPADGPRGRGEATPLSDRLSPQESRILLGLVQGRSNKEIANDLGIREATVKVHLRACYEKIGARNRTQAALWASERLNGLV